MIKIPKPESCKTCTLYNADGIVHGEGPTRGVKMMLVGEAPGAEEAAALRPFIGGSGRVLSALLNHAQISRPTLYITNVVKCRPTRKRSDGRIVNRTPTQREIAHCLPFLLEEIHTINPNVIVPLGNIPLHALTTRTRGIMAERSVPHLTTIERNNGDQTTKVEKYKAVATQHPAHIMRQQHLWPLAVFDLARAGAESATPILSRRPWAYHIHARLADVGDALRRRIRELGRYHHDLETTGLRAHTSAISCIGLAAEPSTVFCFDWTDDVQRFVADLHTDSSLTCVGQNSESFDIPFQEDKGIRFAGPTYDTMIGWHLLNSTLPKDLGVIGATCTDEEAWKDDTMYRSDFDGLQVGCCRDVHATGRAYEDQHKELAQLGQLDLYYKHIMPLQPVLRSMMRRGLRKNLLRAGGWHVELNRRADALEVKLRTALGNQKFSVDSHQQLSNLLYTQMGLPVQYAKNASGDMRPTVNADALDHLAMIADNPILKVIRSIRTYRKWDSTYVACEHDARGFVHPTYGVAKATTGRINSKEPNGQNWPAPIRDIIIPDDDDHIFVARDWSQMEWRIAMALSGDAVGLDALTQGLDAHQSSYALAFSKEYDAVTYAERQEAKAINYGVMYGRGARALAQGRLGHPESAIDLSLVNAYIKNFFSRFSAYDAYRDWLKNQAKSRKFLTTAWGRRRYWYTQQIPEIYNYPMQANSAHMMYEALVECEAQLPPSATLRTTAHDELVVHSPRDSKTLRDVINCTREVMEKVCKKIEDASLRPDVLRKYYPHGWHCPTDYHIGRTWKECKGFDEEPALRITLGVEDLR